MAGVMFLKLSELRPIRRKRDTELSSLKGDA